jgi:glycosyltransferase involved in cell wall biosynthesis
MTLPAISVVMPVYNAERYVGEATRSILTQTFRDFEFVIIDDGSTDGSPEILERFAAGDGRIRLVSRPNTGIVGALNEGLAMARADLIARMDGDDVARPDRLERQAAYLAEHPECVMVGSRVLVIDPDGRPLKVMGDALTHEEIDQGCLDGRGQPVYHPAVMYRRRVVLEVGAYREIYEDAEDLDLFFRLAEVGRIANLEEPLLEYREHMAKVGRARAASQAACCRRIVEDTRRRRGLPPPPPAPPVRVRTESDTLRTWGWWALSSGHVSTARKYATASLARTPFAFDSWKLLACAVRGR